MVAVKAQDVMDRLLSCDTAESTPGSEQLDFLIYRNTGNLEAQSARSRQGDRDRAGRKDRVTVQIGDSRANIRIRVSQRSQPDISMKGIAEIAAQAIVDELRRGFK